jgi:hypothetical protein
VSHQVASLFLIAAMQPLFSPQELRALPCGWHRTTSDTVRTDVRSTARLVDKVLSVRITGSEGPRTAFLIVDGQEVQIDAVGPLEIHRFISRNKKHKIVLGTVIHDRIWFGEVRCLST